MKILFIGDVVGRPGREILAARLRGLINTWRADLVIVNGDVYKRQESINAILEMSRYKKRGKCRVLAALGCLTQKYGPELSEALPEVDLFLGVTDWVGLLTLLDQRLGQGGTEDRQGARLLVGPYDQHLYSNPVSYTHLDVYKRQIQVCLGTRGVALEDDRNYPLYLLNNICLLYTSRCV